MVIYLICLERALSENSIGVKVGIIPLLLSPTPIGLDCSDPHANNTRQDISKLRFFLVFTVRVTGVGIGVACTGVGFFLNRSSNFMVDVYFSPNVNRYKKTNTGKGTI
jgi:hypothetical protein